MRTNKYGPLNLTNKKLIGIVKQIYFKLGYNPGIKYFKASNKVPSAKTYYNRFGAWSKVTKLAGIPAIREENWTKYKIILLLKNIKKKYKRTPRINDSGIPDSRIFKKLSWSWDAALKEIECVPYILHHSKEDIINFIKNYEKRHKHLPKQRMFKNSICGISHSAIVRKFGSYNKALTVAGFSREIFDKPKKYNELSLVKHLNKFVKKYKRYPSWDEWSALKNRPSAATYFHTFGSWNNALNRVGAIRDFRTTESSYTVEKSVKSLLDFYKKYKRPPKVTECKNSNNMASPSTYRKYIDNSWYNILKSLFGKTNRILGEDSITLTNIIYDLYLNGLNYAEIGDAIGVSYSVVSGRCRHYTTQIVEN